MPDNNTLNRVAYYVLPYFDSELPLPYDLTTTKCSAGCGTTVAVAKSVLEADVKIPLICFNCHVWVSSPEGSA